MKLAELLLQRAQLQKDLTEQAERIMANAQVLDDEEPLEDPDAILKGSCVCLSVVQLSRVRYHPRAARLQQVCDALLLPNKVAYCVAGCHQHVTVLCRILDNNR